MASGDLVEKYVRKAKRLGLEGETEFATEEQVWPFGSARGGGDPGPIQVRIL